MLKQHLEQPLLLELYSCKVDATLSLKLDQVCARNESPALQGATQTNIQPHTNLRDKLNKQKQTMQKTICTSEDS